MNLLVPAGIALGAIYILKKSKPKSQPLSYKDKGFIFDCKSFVITDVELFKAYFRTLVATVSKQKQFSDPYTINLHAFVLECIKRLNKKCYDKIIKSEVPKSEGPLFGAIAKYILDAYLNVTFGILSERDFEDINWSENLSEDEIIQQKQYWDYLASTANHQILDIVSLFGLSPNDADVIIDQIVINGKYP